MERHNVNEAKRSKQITKYLFDNRKNLTEEQYSNLIEVLKKEIYTFAYASGWHDRNLIQRTASTQRRIRMKSDFDEFYTTHMRAIGNINKTKPLVISQLELVENMIRDWL